ncbi:MAG TPA: AMP-binding protein [Thermoleophilaceae bacterium]
MTLTPAIPTRSAAATNLIWEAYETARDDRPLLYCWDESSYRSHDWDGWRSAAERSAVGLRRLGVHEGARVAAVLTNRFEVCSAVVGTWLAGGTLLSLPLLRRGQDAEDYVAQLRRLCRDAQPEVLLLEGRFIELLGGADLGVPVASFESLAVDGTLDPTPPPDDATAFVQYSSGSMSEPKGCELTLAAIGAQERMLIERLDVDDKSRGVTWLPLSHDMGLFGCVMVSWCTGLCLAVGTPERFLRKPHTWMEDCIEFEATNTVSPNFGLSLAAQRARTKPPSGSFPLRSLVLGAERIEWTTLNEAVEVLGPHGVTMESITPAYGLAEATLAVTMKPPDEAPNTVRVDAEAAYRGELILHDRDGEGTLPMVACGPPMDGVSVRTRGDRSIGRICIRSEALARGYMNQPETTRECFRHGEFVSEDVGFVHDGELYVLGRTDDAIPVGGRNVFARDIELALGDCGARRGCATLVDIPDDDHLRLVLVAEPSPETDDFVALADAMNNATFDRAGVRADECVLLRPGTLPKTPSGKIQRFRCRALLSGDGADAVLERVPL